MELYYSYAYVYRFYINAFIIIEHITFSIVILSTHLTFKWLTTSTF